MVQPGSGCERYVEDRLPKLSVALNTWIDQTILAAGSEEDPERKKTLYRAALDYGQARCSVLGLLNDVEAQVGLYSDLAF